MHDFRQLVERIVKVLSLMKCPVLIEPHQISGLDFINIYRLLQWLVKESVNQRIEKSDQLKTFAVGQFQNFFNLNSSMRVTTERSLVIKAVKEIDNMYTVQRKFKRKLDIEPENEKDRVSLTLLEYGIKSIARHSTNIGETKTNPPQQSEVLIICSLRIVELVHILSN